MCTCVCVYVYVCVYGGGGVFIFIGLYERKATNVVKAFAAGIMLCPSVNATQSAGGFSFNATPDMST